MRVGSRAVVLVIAVMAGTVCAAALDLRGIDTSPMYYLAVTTLLSLGLYVATSGIDMDEFRSQFGLVALAVTVGVAAKILLIFAVMYLVFGDPEFLLVAVAVAQIDPLSVAAIQAKSRMSPRAKTLLAAWASFDDPITALCAVYAAAIIAGTPDGPGDLTLYGNGLTAFVLNLGLNLAFAGIVFICWHVVHVRPSRPASRRWAVRTVAVAGGLLSVLVIGSVAVYGSLWLGLAIIGLFCRPRWGSLLGRRVPAALVLAMFAAGMVLVDGIDLVAGLVLGLAAYLAQVVVAFVLTVRKQWRGERARLVLAQQNGMTSIVLGLLIVPVVPGSIAILVPAVVVVNLVHAVANAVWDRIEPPVVGDTGPATLPVAPLRIGAHRPANPETEVV